MTDNKLSIRRILPPWLSGLWGKIAFYSTLYSLVYLGWVAFHRGAARRQGRRGKRSGQGSLFHVYLEADEKWTDQGNWLLV